MLEAADPMKNGHGLTVEHQKARAALDREGANYYSPRPRRKTRKRRAEVGYVKHMTVQKVHPGTPIMKEANVNSRVLELSASNWVPKKGIVYGGTVIFNDTGQEHFAMIFSKELPNRLRYDKNTQTAEVMLLAAGENTTLDVVWNAKQMKLTALFPIPQIRDVYAENRKFIAAAQKSGLYDETKKITCDLARNDELLREKLNCDLLQFKRIITMMTNRQCPRSVVHENEFLKLQTQVCE